METTSVSIGPEERGLAAITHLSGLAGYIIPFGGVLVPIIIWMVKKDPRSSRASRSRRSCSTSSRS